MSHESSTASDLGAVQFAAAGGSAVDQLTPSEIHPSKGEVERCPISLFSHGLEEIPFCPLGIFFCGNLPLGPELPAEPEVAA